MAEGDFHPGALVFAKMKGYSPWPAKVVSRVQNVKHVSYKVNFFGTYDTTTLQKAAIYPYNEINKIRYGMRRANRKSWNIALDEIENAAKPASKKCASSKKTRSAAPVSDGEAKAGNKVPKQPSRKKVLSPDICAPFEAKAEMRKQSSRKRDLSPDIWAPFEAKAGMRKQQRDLSPDICSPFQSPTRQPSKRLPPIRNEKKTTMTSRPAVKAIPTVATKDSATISAVEEEISQGSKTLTAITSPDCAETKSVLPGMEKDSCVPTPELSVSQVQCFDETSMARLIAAANAQSQNEIEKINQILENNKSLLIKAPDEQHDLQGHDEAREERVHGNDLQQDCEKQVRFRDFLAQNRPVEESEGNVRGAVPFSELLRARNQELRLEEQAVHIISQITLCLGIQQAEPYKAIQSLEQLEIIAPQLSRLILLRSRTIFDSIFKLRHYTGNNKEWHLQADRLVEFENVSAKIREIATSIYRKFARVFMPDAVPRGSAVQKMFNAAHKSFNEMIQLAGVDGADDFVFFNGAMMPLPQPPNSLPSDDIGS